MQVADIEGDAPSAKRLRRSPSDALQDMVSGEELSLFGSTPNKTESAQVVFQFAYSKDDISDKVDIFLVFNSLPSCQFNNGPF